MQIFYADTFVRACKRLERLKWQIHSSEQWRTEVEYDLIMLKKEFDRIGFNALAEQAQRIIGKTKMPVSVVPGPTRLDTANLNRVTVLLDELSKAIEQKLRTCLFLRLTTDKQRYYLEENRLFGSEIRSKFPQAAHDIGEASRCFALERWDAAVHHLMVTTEIAMRKWAKDMGVRPNRRLI